MAKLNINIGASANDKSGDTLRVAFGKANSNFAELYTLTGGTSTALTELAQDYAAPLFNHASHTNITATYDDANNKILLTGVASAVWPVTNTAGANGPTRIAIGNSAGDIAQGNATVAVGSYAGNDTQGGAAVAIGTYAGTTTQRNDAIAIGYLTGNDVQGTGAVSIGRQAGQTNQGAYSIAIGKLAGQTNQAANTIILNALNAPLNGVSAQTNSFYVNPIRTDATPGNVLFYNTTTKEITYGAASSVSSLVNGAYTVSLGSDGKLTAPGNLQVDGGKIILNTGGNAYVESVNYGVNTATSALNIFGGPYQKINLRAGFGTQATWTFGTDGSLTLPGGAGSLFAYGDALQLDGAQDTGIQIASLGEGYTRLLWSGGQEVGNVMVHSGSDRVIITAGNLTTGLNEWKFNNTGAFTFPDNTVQTTAFQKVAPPAHDYGAAGDKIGMMAFDAYYIYYCTADYVNNATVIWKRTAYNTIGTW